MKIRKIKTSNKSAQAQVIVTVLLILIVLAAIGLVSTFVFGLIRDNLTGTECFKTIGELSLNEKFTYYDSNQGLMYVSINRGTEAFDLAGIVVGVGGGAISKPYQITNDSVKDLSVEGGVILYQSPGEDIILPGTQETLTYTINVSSLKGNVEEISVSPLVGDSRKQCDVVIESNVVVK